jgi:hypothetical protein
MSDNVIIFPREKVGGRVSPTEQDIKDNLDTFKYTHIQETVSLVAPILFQHISLAGFDIFEDDDSDESLKESAFLVEAIRAILCKYYGLDHPFQKLSQNLFKIEEDGLLSIVDKIELELVDKKDEVESEN